MNHNSFCWYFMPVDLKTLTEKTVLKQHCQSLSVEQLERVYSDLCALIADRKAFSQERELKRKGDRVLDDMRGLMAKAGVSMSEFQAALERL